MKWGSCLCAPHQEAHIPHPKANGWSGEGLPWPAAARSRADHTVMEPPRVPAVFLPRPGSPGATHGNIFNFNQELQVPYTRCLNQK